MKRARLFRPAPFYWLLSVLFSYFILSFNPALPFPSYHPERYQRKQRQRPHARGTAAAAAVDLVDGDGGLGGLQAVSYTHLDVYKRQVRSISSSRY